MIRKCFTSSQQYAWQCLCWCSTCHEPAMVHFSHPFTHCLVARPAVLVSSRAKGSCKTSAEMHRKVGDVDREAQHTWRSCIKGRRLAVDGAVDGVRERAACRRPRRIAQQHKLALEADAEVDAVPLARQADDFAQRIPRAALPVCVCASCSRLARVRARARARACKCSFASQSTGSSTVNAERKRL